jgi:hypothetical protein
MGAVSAVGLSGSLRAMKDNLLRRDALLDPEPRLRRQKKWCIGLLAAVLLALFGRQLGDVLIYLASIIDAVARASQGPPLPF